MQKSEDKGICTSPAKEFLCLGKSPNIGPSNMNINALIRSACFSVLVVECQLWKVYIFSQNLQKSSYLSSACDPLSAKSESPFEFYVAAAPVINRS